MNKNLEALHKQLLKKSKVNPIKSETSQQKEVKTTILKSKELPNTSANIAR